jgi:hypothetical protein
MRPAAQPQAEQEISLDADRWSGFRDTFGEREVGIDSDGSPIELLRLVREISPAESALAERMAKLAKADRPGVARAIRLEQDDQKRRPRLVMVSERVAGVRLAEAMTRGAGRSIVPDIGAAMFVMRRLFTIAGALKHATGIQHFIIAPERVVITPRAEIVVVEAALAGATEALGATEAFPKAVRLALSEMNNTKHGLRLDIARIARIGVAMLIGRPIEATETVDALSPVLNEVSDVAAIRAGDAFAAAMREWLEQALTIEAGVSFDDFHTASVALDATTPPKDCAASRATLRSYVDHLQIDDFAQPEALALEFERVRAIRVRQTMGRRGRRGWINPVAHELGLPHKDEVLQESPAEIAAKPRDAKIPGAAAEIDMSTALDEMAEPAASVAAASDEPAVFDLGSTSSPLEADAKVWAPAAIPPLEPVRDSVIKAVASRFGFLLKDEGKKAAHTADAPPAPPLEPAPSATQPAAPPAEVAPAAAYPPPLVIEHTSMAEPPVVMHAAPAAEPQWQPAPAMPTLPPISPEPEAAMAGEDAAAIAEPREGGKRKKSWFRSVAKQFGIGEAGSAESDLTEPPSGADAALSARAAEEEALRAAEEADAKRLADQLHARNIAAVAEAQRAAAEARRLAGEAEAQRQEQEARRRAAEEEARRVAEARRLAAETEARRIAEEEARRVAEAEAQRLAEEAEARRVAEEAEARRRAEQEARRLAAEAEARRRAEEEAKRLAAEAEARRRAEEEARRRAEEEARRLAAEAEARRRAEEEARRLAAEAEARRRKEEEARRRAEEEARRAAAEAEARRRAEEEARRHAAEAEARRAAEAEARRLAAEAEARRLEEAETRRIALEAQARREAEAAALRRAAEEAARHQTEQAGPGVDEEVDEEPVEAASRETWIKSMAAEMGLKPDPSTAPQPPAAPSWQAKTPAIGTPRPQDWKPAQPANQPPPSPYQASASSAAAGWQAPTPAYGTPKPSAYGTPSNAAGPYSPYGAPSQSAYGAPTPTAYRSPSGSAPSPAPAPAPAPSWQTPSKSEHVYAGNSEEPEEEPRGRKVAGAASLMRSAALLIVAAGLVGGLGWAGWSYYSRTARPGSVSIESNPSGAEIFVDGASKGVTPLTIALPPGRHNLELRRRGATRQISVEVAAGQQLRQQIDLTNLKPIGTLVVNSEPKGAKVIVDGRERGVTPLRLADMSVGAHKVVLQSTSGSIAKDVQIQAGGTVTIDEGIFSGWIAVFAPFDVEVYERRRRIGTTDNERIMLQPGRHELDLVNTQRGFRDTRIIDLGSGATVAINVETTEGILRIDAPAGAEILIDGLKVGDAPIGDQTVTLGIREISVRHPELGEKKVSATVTSSGPAEVKVEFTPPQD